MSVLTNPPVHIIDSVQAYDAVKTIPCVEGVIQTSFLSFQPQSINTSSITYSVLPPSMDSGTGDIYYHFAGTAVFAGTSPGAGSMVNGVVVGLSDNALDQICSNESVNFGSKQNSVQRYLCGVELDRLNTPSQIQAQQGSGMSSNLKDFGISFPAWASSNRNVLAGVYDVPQSDQVPVPRTVGVTVIASTATALTVSFDFWAVSRVSPFNQTNIPKPALRGLNNILFKLTFTEYLQNMFSLIVPSGYTVSGMSSFAFDATNTQIWAKFITPSKNAFKEMNPNDYIYNYNEVQVWQSGTNILPTNGTNVNLSLQQISGNVIPDKLMIFARDQYGTSDALNGCLTPRCWYPLTDNGSINLKFNNETVLNGAVNMQLYQMSLRNGLSQCTYDQFRGSDLTTNQTGAYVVGATSLVLGGGMLVIDPALDCNLSRIGLTNGARAQWTLQGSVQYYNNRNAAANNVELVVIAIYGGYAQIMNGKVNADTGLLDQHEVLECLNSGAVPLSSAIFNHSGMSSQEGYSGGANFLDILKKAATFVYDNRKELQSLASSAASAYKNYKGKGDGYESGGYLSGGEIDGGYLSGGRHLNTSHRALSKKKHASEKYL